MILRGGTRGQPRLVPEAAPRRTGRQPPGRNRRIVFSGGRMGRNRSVKGDWVEIVIDAGGEDARTYEVTATKAGRRVEIANRRGVVEVSEVTRSGTPVRTARFMASRLPALGEP